MPKVIRDTLLAQRYVGLEGPQPRRLVGQNFAFEEGVPLEFGQMRKQKKSATKQQKEEQNSNNEEIREKKSA